MLVSGLPWATKEKVRFTPRRRMSPCSSPTHLSALSTKELAAVGADPRDSIGRWAREYLMQAKDRSLGRMLDAAMLRTYSASPYEMFYTGGGMHRFENFESEDNGRVLTVREGFKRSVNLVFIRLMRDVVNHVIAQTQDANAWPLDRRAAASRQSHLSRFADREGRQYIARFYRKYQGTTPQQAEDLLLRAIRATPTRLASVLGVLEPQASVDDLTRFMQQRRPRGERGGHFGQRRSGSAGARVR